MKIFLRLMKYIRPNLKYLFIGLLFSFLEMISHLGLPYVLKTFIDEVLTQKNGQIFYQVVIGYFLLTFTIVIFGLIKEYYYTLINETTIKESRKSLYEHLRTIPAIYFEKYKVGKLMSYFINDIPNMVGKLPATMIDLIRNFTRLFCSIVILWYIDYKILLILLILLPFYLLNATLFNKPIRNSTEELQEQKAKITDSLQEHISGTNEILVFNQKEWDLNNIKNRFIQRIKSTIKNSMWIKTSNQTGFLIYWLAITVVYLIGGRNVLQGTMTIGTVFFYEKYIDNIYMPARLLIVGNNNLQSFIAIGKRYFNFMDTTSSKSESENKKIHTQKFKHSIKFNNVSFKYEKDYVLKNMSFEIPRGKKAAIIGESGSGKSTLIKLLLNLYNADKGKILIDGHNINHIDSKSLYKLISVVFQEPFLFSDTIAENIKFGKPDASRDEIIEAAKFSCAHDFIMGMENGYETILTERGNSLSGGQKQRIAVARAIINDSNILIFDEATSSLDVNNKRKVLNNIYQMDKTVIFITHDLHDIEKADQIIILDKGQVNYVGQYSNFKNYKYNIEKNYRIGD